jgi:ribonuclease P protein component
MPALNDKLEVIKKRTEFLAVASSGKRWVSPVFILQVSKPHEPTPCVRYGITASGKIGNAVVRNRAKRRLRALAADVLVHAAHEHDYVLVAREKTPTCVFAAMQQELVKGLTRFGLLREKA